MSKIKNGELHQYATGPFEQQQFGTSGVEGVKSSFLYRVEMHIHVSSCMINSKWKEYVKRKHQRNKSPSLYCQGHWNLHGLTSDFWLLNLIVLYGMRLTLKQPDPQWFGVPQMPNTSPEGSTGWHWQETDYIRSTLISQSCESAYSQFRRSAGIHWEQTLSVPAV